MNYFYEDLEIVAEDKKLLVLNHGYIKSILLIANSSIKAVFICSVMLYFLVYNSDAHTNNMMFQSNGLGEIAAQKIIDFQLTRFGSLNLDLQYCIFSSVRPVVRRAKLQDMLAIYFNTFNKACEDLGYPADLSFEVQFIVF